MTGGDWYQAIAFYQHLTGLGFQRWHDYSSGVPAAVGLWYPFCIIGVPIIVCPTVLH